MNKDDEKFDMNKSLDEIYGNAETFQVKIISLQEASALPVGEMKGESLDYSCCFLPQGETFTTQENFQNIAIPLNEVEPLNLSCTCKNDMELFDEYCIGRQFHQIFRCGLCNIEKDVCFKVQSETFRDFDGNELQQN